MPGASRRLRKKTPFPAATGLQRCSTLHSDALVSTAAKFLSRPQVPQMQFRDFEATKPYNVHCLRQRGHEAVTQEPLGATVDCACSPGVEQKAGKLGSAAASIDSTHTNAATTHVLRLDQSVGGGLRLEGPPGKQELVTRRGVRAAAPHGPPRLCGHSGRQVPPVGRSSSRVRTPQEAGHMTLTVSIRATIGGTTLRPGRLSCLSQGSAGAEKYPPLRGTKEVGRLACDGAARHPESISLGSSGARFRKSSGAKRATSSARGEEAAAARGRSGELSLTAGSALLK